MHYYRFYLSDYAAATAHLTNAEDLAYRRLLDLAYSTEIPIPTDIPALTRRLRSDPEVICAVLNEFFERTPEGWINKRCQEQLGKYGEYKEKQSRNGRKGGRPNKPRENPPLNGGIPNANPTLTQTKPYLVSNNQYPISERENPHPLSSDEGEEIKTPTDALHDAGSDQWRLCTMLAAVLLKHDQQRIMPNGRDWCGYLEVITELTQKYAPARLAAIFKLMEHRGFPKNGNELDLSTPWWLRKSFKAVEDHAYAMTVEADRKQLAEWSKREFPN